jgi:hypothetical protein
MSGSLLLPFPRGVVTVTPFLLCLSPPAWHLPFVAAAAEPPNWRQLKANLPVCASQTRKICD